MQKKALEALAEQELDLATSASRTLRQRHFRAGEYSERMLYPELKLKSPYTYCVGNIQAACLLPLYNTVIVDLRPLARQAFEHRYGLSVDQFSRYVEQGRIAPRLRVPYREFVGLDYLDDLLRRQPPVSRRYIHLYGDVHAGYLEAGRSRCPMGRRLSTHWNKEYDDWKAKPSFRDVFAYKYALVSCYVGEDEARRIAEEATGRTKDAAAAYDWLHRFSRLRVYPSSNCLDGVNTLSVHDWEFAHMTATRGAMVLRGETPTFEVGRAVLLNMPLDLPGDLDRAMKVSPSLWMKTIHSLDAALRSQSQNEVGNVCTRISRLAQATRDEVEAMRNRKEAISRFGARLGALGIVGLLSRMAPDWDWIIGGTSGAAVGFKDHIADGVVKFRRADHVVAWFDLRKAVDSN